jgi:hypothetical protein
MICFMKIVLSGISAKISLEYISGMVTIAGMRRFRLVHDWNLPKAHKCRCLAKYECGGL